MITREELAGFAKKQQTNAGNAAREYLQHMVISQIYRQAQSEHVLFKGGTALRFIFQSPRFSEDLDFSGFSIRRPAIEQLLEEALVGMERESIPISLSEAKTTTGGYLSILAYDLHGYRGEIRIEISLRPAARKKGEFTTVISGYTIPYTLLHLPAKDLVSEKIQALLRRGKPRDYYDLYFILRHPVLDRVADKEKLHLIRNRLSREKTDFRQELVNLLPTSHHGILRDFKGVLNRELERYP